MWLVADERQISWIYVHRRQLAIDNLRLTVIV